ncbi:MAG: peptidoglycan-associated lipoprotein Pal [Thalassotalea sp.]
MRFNKIVKALAVSLPLLAISACSSTDTSEEDARIAAEQAQVAAQAQASQEAEQVKVAAAQREAEMAEQKRQAMEKLLAANIIYFEFDKSTLSADFSAILEAHAKFLNANTSRSVLVEGHADERGTPEYNIALGERRAKAVVSYLENMGVAASQITTVSYGEEKPMAKDRTEEAFATNRRAVLVY